MTRLTQHWRFLLFGFLLCWGTFPGQTFFFSLFNRQIRAEFELSHGDFGFFYLLATLASALTLSALGGWIDRLPLKRWSYAVIGLLLIAGLCFALAPNLLLFTLAIYLLRLSGQGLLSHTAMTSMARYFSGLRGRALAIAGLGYPVAESSLPFIVPLLLAALDWRDAWLWLLGGVALVLLPAVQLLLGGARTFGELAASGGQSGGQSDDQPGDRASDATGEPAPPAAAGMSRGQMLRSGTFWLLAPMVVTPSFLITGWFFHHQHVAAEYAWPLADFALAFSAYALAAVTFNLICGALTDRCGARRLLWLPLLPLAACNLPLLAPAFSAQAAPPLWAGWLSFFLMGVNNGAVGTVIGAVWAELFGIRHLGSIKALAAALMVFGSALAPFAMGTLFDAGASVAAVAAAGLALCGLGVVCGAVLSLRARRPAPFEGG